jgi:hypothetical protein
MSRTHYQDVPIEALRSAVAAILALVPRAPGVKMEISEAECTEQLDGSGWSRVHFTFKYRPQPSENRIVVPPRGIQ